MHEISLALTHLVQRLERFGPTLELRDLSHSVAYCIQDICLSARPETHWVQKYKFHGLHSAFPNAIEDNRNMSLQDHSKSIVFAAKLLQNAMARHESIVHAEGDARWCSYQIPEPTGDSFVTETRQVSR